MTFLRSPCSTCPGYYYFKGTDHSFSIWAKSLANGFLMIVLKSQFSPHMRVGPVIFELVSYRRTVFVTRKMWVTPKIVTSDDPIIMTSDLKIVTKYTKIVHRYEIWNLQAPRAYLGKIEIIKRLSGNHLLTI